MFDEVDEMEDLVSDESLKAFITDERGLEAATARHLRRKALVPNALVSSAAVGPIALLAAAAAPAGIVVGAAFWVGFFLHLQGEKQAEAHDTIKEQDRLISEWELQRFHR